jgi:hypothetical protein
MPVHHVKHFFVYSSHAAVVKVYKYYDSCKGNNKAVGALIKVTTTVATTTVLKQQQLQSKI